MMTWLVAVAALTIGEGSAAMASWNAPAQEPARLPAVSAHSPDRIIAVGFGYQRGTTSSIRIRTYHVASGDMLSEDQFDLNVVGGEARDSEPVGDRIFAGTVDVTAGGLGDFPMRVYDAQSGRYLWQGRLNFVEMGSEDPRRRARMPQAGALSSHHAQLVVDTTPGDIQSQFWVRAVDPSTGQALWQQSFKSSEPSAEVIGESPKMETVPSAPVNDYEIVIRSYERRTGNLVWSDRLSTRDRVEDMVEEETPEHAQRLPLFAVPEPQGKVWM